MTAVTAKRFSIAEYDRLAELGFFESDNRFELIRGEIIKMAAKGRIHSVCNTLLVEELIILLARRARVRVQEPIILSDDSEPEPDVVIAQNRSDNYVSSHPLAADILLVIEVSDSTLKYDRRTKLSLYAESGISDYWIFNLVDTQLEMNSEPYQKQTGDFDYRAKGVVSPNEVVVIPGFPELSLDLSAVFPAQMGE
ncbi:MAG: Uma2 family endonuclease [Microcoleus sp. PH2017_10_PVI_O_A]|uniref:Uma2 family endonuclease n=1 Tax=unclassified Microcoleus TaxID=2642155 RepID=UPI001DAFB88F|nr:MULTISPECIES: Uma2 family endonuclease [unclassified Microcoleus]TAE79760.1 MAG: Uma2 family endonuclease [Oscillatoriales cyanobacterium]MCC3408059.1 Uma2 family endonuclease [Microcoleus sp. PH2017_10_PVI_O_A]MCC3462179.1 Uma2 family endonuclease [Microcoleus sp. PH2017_11_PCY_U_A]MCC3480611.1 Uma2 family endonuclease [Microcoleus sp. PH2017_12_PCY_D_A]MCC3530575.1 Uma2 family endonuclease [Microcoleus sp. PH2017_21_RUC_O_A]